MSDNEPTRRDWMKAASTAMAAGLAQMTFPSFVFPAQGQDEELVRFLNTPRAVPGALDWEGLESWLTPQDEVFAVSHYKVPTVDASKHTLEISGLVNKPLKFTMEQLKKLAPRDQLMTLECSGNNVNPGFSGAIYNSKWTGVALKPLLEMAGVKPEATEVVFFGADKQKETIRKVDVDVPFGRSLSIPDAHDDNILLAFARNDKPLTPANGAPLRLIVPGWYGVANVKWLTRIELWSTRYMGRFMARDYVTLRGERRGSEIVYVERSVTRMNLKSAIARVTRKEAKDGKYPLKVYGAVWGPGTDIKSVEVKLDDGKWLPATIDKEPRSKYCWAFFSLDLGPVSPGKHTLVSRATDVEGRVQPAATDDEIALKKTYWEAYQQWPREIELAKPA